jgi:hypothetical protein
LDAVPPGQQPTRITPAATSGDIGITVVRSTASSGMMMNWPSTPIATSKGRFATSEKSFAEIVRPMPNMMMPSSTTIHGAKMLKAEGRKKPATANTITQNAKVRPTKSEMFEISFIVGKALKVAAGETTPPDDPTTESCALFYPALRDCNPFAACCDIKTLSLAVFSPSRNC